MPRGLLAFLEKTSALPWCIDLDGTLLCADVHTLLWRRLSWAQKLVSLWIWLRQGRVAWKRFCAEATPLPLQDLPWRQDFLAFLRRAQKRGLTFVLATGAHEIIARRVHAHLGLFSLPPLATKEKNGVGAQKAQSLHERFPQGYIYFGDSLKDRFVWDHAALAFWVAPSWRARLFYRLHPKTPCPLDWKILESEMLT